MTASGTLTGIPPPLTEAGRELDLMLAAIKTQMVDMLVADYGNDRELAERRVMMLRPRWVKKIKEHGFDDAMAERLALECLRFLRVGAQGFGPSRLIDIPFHELILQDMEVYEVLCMVFVGTKVPHIMIDLSIQFAGMEVDAPECSAGSTACFRHAEQVYKPECGAGGSNCLNTGHAYSGLVPLIADTAAAMRQQWGTIDEPLWATAA